MKITAPGRRRTFNRGGLLLNFVTAVIVFVCTTAGSSSNDLSNVRNTLLEKIDKPTPTRFLIGIFTTQQDVQRRELLRSTMLSSELPEATRSRLCSLQAYMTDTEQHHECQIIYTFVIGAGDADAGFTYPDTPTSLLVENEGDESDLVLLNIQENMNQGKTPSWFHYASTLLDEYGIHYVTKADSDTLVSIPQLLDFVNHDLPRSHVYGGVMMDHEGCGGERFDYCTDMKSKVYMAGQFSFCSRDIVKFLSEHRLDASYKEATHEDFNLGLHVWGYPHALNIVALNPNVFWEHSKALKDEGVWRKRYEAMKHNDWQIQKRILWYDVFKVPPKGAGGDKMRQSTQRKQQSSTGDNKRGSLPSGGEVRKLADPQV